MYNPANRICPVPRPVPSYGAALPLPEVECPLTMLTSDLLLEVFSRLTPRDATRCMAVCRRWRTVAQSQSLWRAASLSVHAWGEPALVERHNDRFFLGSWRLMYQLRPRLRTDGLYVSRNTYLRRGVVELSSRVPVHVVVFYRYYAFFSNGTFLYRTTPGKPSAQRVMARPRAALRVDGIMSGDLDVRDTAVHTAITYTHGSVSHVHTWLRLRSTCLGANDRLDVRSMVQVEDGQPVPPEPSMDHDAYSDEQGLGWHATPEGALGGWNAGLVRVHSRGLSRFVFVPWDQLDTTILNADAQEMDFYVPG